MTYTPKLDRIELDGTSTPMALITQVELDELKDELEERRIQVKIGQEGMLELMKENETLKAALAVAEQQIKILNKKIIIEKFGNPEIMDTWY